MARVRVCLCVGGVGVAERARNNYGGWTSAVGRGKITEGKSVLMMSSSLCCYFRDFFFRKE